MEVSRFLGKVAESLDRFLFVITGFALIFSTLLTFIGVFLRYIFGISFEWNEELCRYSMILIVYLWAGTMIRKKEHIYFNLISDRFKGRVQLIHSFIVALLTVSLGLPIILWGFELVNNAKASELRTLSLLFPLWPAYALVPIGMIFITIYAFLEILRIGSLIFSGVRKTGS
ncbi:MAG: TRAP transporter small permease [Thermodesulfobacteriota bacterium]